MKFVAALLGALALGSTWAHSETVTMAADPWPPYIYENHPEGGVSIQIIREALGRQGYTVEFTMMPWARAMRSVRSGDIDVLPDIWYTQERGEFLRFSDPYVLNELRFIKRTGDDFGYQGLDSLKGKTVGIVRGYGYGRAFYEADFKREPASDLVTNLRKLVWERLDLTIGDEMVARFRLASEAPELKDQIEFVEPSYATKEMHIAVGRTNPRGKDIIRAFNEGLAEMQQDGTFAAILKENDLPLSVITE